MKTGASSLLFSMLCRICGFSTMVFLKSAILRFLAFKNIISIIIAFLLSMLYITPTLLLDIMYGAGKTILCDKFVKLKFLKKRPVSKFFAKTFYKIVSNGTFAFFIIVISITISFGAVVLFGLVLEFLLLYQHVFQVLYSRSGLSNQHQVLQHHSGSKARQERVD